MVQFSIIIPCFNAADTIVDTLQSIRQQDVKDWEVICVDDGSTDKTRDIIAMAAHFDARISLVRNMGKGPSAARNFGANHFANAPVVAFCDADDVWGPHKLSELNTAFKDTSIGAVFSQVAFFKQLPADARVFSSVPRSDLTIMTLLGENPVCTMSNIAVRQDVFARMQGFDTSLVHNEDLEWLIRLVGQGTRVVGLQSLQVWYRTSVSGLSSDLQAMSQARQNAIRTAATFGVRPSRSAQAIYARYLARRALRLGQGRTVALRFALKGLLQSPKGFFQTPKRGWLTLIGAFVHVVLPTQLSHVLFSR